MNAPLSVLSAAAECPDSLAWVIGDQRFTFSEMAVRTRAVMHWLENRFRPLSASESKIPSACFAVVATNQLATVTLVYAMAELGIPLALIHPKTRSSERAALIQRLPVIHLFDPGWEQDLPDAPGDYKPEPRVHPPLAPLCIVYTSGSTAAAKAAVLSRAALEHAIDASAHNLGWQASDRWLLCLPIAHVGGLSILFRCLAARKAVVMPQPQSENDGLDLHRIAQGMAEHQVTLMSVVPTLLQRFLALQHFILPLSVRAVLVGGDSASPALLDIARKRSYPVFTTYGMTEMASQVCSQRFALGPGKDTGNGPPVLGAQLRIGEGGRIEVRGPSLFSGYWDPPQLNLPLTADGWFRTDDLGRIDDQGCVHVVGRLSELLISGGENVSPGHVERTIEAFPGVARCCVFGLPDSTWGEVVCALLIGPPAFSPELLTYLRQHLMPHELPRRGLLLPTLPETAAGKLDRKEAARRYREQLFPLEYF